MRDSEKQAIESRLARTDNRSSAESVRAYDRRRKSQARIAGQDIGELPLCRNPERRLKAKDSLKYHLEVYHPHVFNLAWGTYHHHLIRLAEMAILEGGWFCMAVPRGGGKTKISESAAEWAIVHGHKSWPVLIGSNEDKGLESLASIKRELLANPHLHEDFPEIMHPIVALDDESRRASGQICCGERTRIEWGSKHIVLPTIGAEEHARWSYESFTKNGFDCPADVAGSRIKAFGLTGSFRGMSSITARLKTVRPDLAICDDPQSRESSRSLHQSQQRAATIKGDVAYLNGPNTDMAVLIPCTVIYPNDLAEQMLDRELNPEFHGERHKMLETLPTNLDCWDTYNEIVRECLRLDKPMTRADQYYIDNREVLDKGAVASWPARHPGAVSAIQYAMNLRVRDPVSFQAEAQNEPILDANSEAILATPVEIIQKQHHTPRMVLPAWCDKVVAHIDVHQKLLYHAVCGASLDFEVACCDYGTFPEQQRRYYAYREDLLTIQDIFDGQLDVQLRKAIQASIEVLASRTYPREDGVELELSMILIDCGYKDSVVMRACRESTHAAITMPIHGIAVGAKDSQLSERKKKPREVKGHEWLQKPKPDTPDRIYAQHNVNYWKSATHVGFKTETGPGSLTLWKDQPERHRLIADHCGGSEFPTRVEAKGHVVDEWSLLPSKPDNHMFDNIVGCLAGLSMVGCVLRGVHETEFQKQRRRPRKFSGRKST